MKFICRLWKGELALPTVFWNWAVLGGLVVNIATTALFFFLISLDRPISALIAGYVFAVPYNVMVTVGVWRSADRYRDDRRWACLAKLVTVVGMVLLSVT